MATWFKNPLRSFRDHPAFRWALAVLVVGLLSVCLPPLALFSYDVSYLAKPTATITNVVLLYFNQDSINQLGGDHGELNRTNHARLVNYLARDGAKLVCYDVVFADADGNPEEDRSLARALQQHGAVVLAAGGTPTELTLPVAELRKAARAWGHCLLFGNVVREISGDVQDEPYLAWVGAVLWHPEQFAGQDPKLRRWLNYYGPPASDGIPHYYLHEVLAGTVPPGTFTGKAVFVGQNFPYGNLAAFKDTFETPYSRFGIFGPMPGVEIHATAFLNLVRGEYLRLIPLEWQWGGAILWGLLCVAVFQRAIGRPKPVLFVTALMLAGSLCAASLYIQWHFHWWWAWFGPAVGQPGTALISVWSRQKAARFAAFISYRKSEDTELALLIREKLSSRGKRVCIDHKSLQAGHFDQQLLDLIEASQFFILILSPKSLARCADEEDWIRRELAHALSHQKTIIPIFKNGFNFSDAEQTPKIMEIAALQRFHGLEYTPSDLDGFLEQLIKLLDQKATKTSVT